MPVGNPNPQYYGFSDFGQSTPKDVLVQLGSTQLLAANPDNRYLVEISNYSDQAMWIEIGVPAEVGKGTRLLPGGHRIYSGTDLFLGALNAITLGSPANIRVIEGVI